VPEKSPKEEPHVLVEAEKIIQKKQFAKGIHQLLAQTYGAPFRLSMYRRTTISLPDYWLEMLDKVRDLTQIEFRDEVTEMRQEIDTLRNRLEFIEQELSSSKEIIDELRTEVYRRPVIKQTELATVGELCKAYVEMVSTINIVRQVLLVEVKNLTTIWTIIDTTPFEDSLRTPIYEAQIKILSTLKEDIPLDFYVLNVSELSENEKTESTVPANAQLLWER
jgi:hypothetical protein